MVRNLYTTHRYEKQGRTFTQYVRVGHVEIDLSKENIVGRVVIAGLERCGPLVMLKTEPREERFSEVKP
jgi:hypothetical protein